MLYNRPHNEVVVSVAPSSVRRLLMLVQSGFVSFRVRACRVRNGCGPDRASASQTQRRTSEDGCGLGSGLG